MRFSDILRPRNRQDGVQGLAAVDGIKARKTFNSRGSPTIEVEVSTKKSWYRAEAPSGASTGLHEVIAYPSGGVEEAVKLVETLVAPKLVGVAVEKQKEVDRLLHEVDGTENFSKIGGDTAIAISLAVSKAAAASKNMLLFQYLSGGKPAVLPHPLGNVLGGGKHAGGKAPDIQEFLALPVEVSSFSEAAWANICVHRKVGKLLGKADVTFTGGKGDEGAWAPNLDSNKALEVVAKAAESVSDELGVDVRVGLDVASSSLWDVKKKFYVYQREGVKRGPGEQIDYVLDLIRTYRLAYVEDPLHEEDFEGFAEITGRVKSCLVCGDDLFTTNPVRLRRGIGLKAGNAIIVKPNQIGTLTETSETVAQANQTVGFC